MSQEEINRINEILSCDNCPTSYACEACDITWTDKNLIKKYISELEQSNEELDKENNRLEKIEFERDKQNKIIDEMAVEIASYDNDETFCKEVYPNNSCEGNGISCWECIKQYFEKKVEKK